MNRFLPVSLVAAVAFVAMLVGALIVFPPAPPAFLECAIREAEEQEPVKDLSAALASLRQIAAMDADGKAQFLFSAPCEAVVTLTSISPGEYDPEPLIVPFKYSFCYGTSHRLTISQLSGRPGVDLYAVLTVAPAHPLTWAYLEKMSIPLSLDKEEVDAVSDGDPITKVVYLPGQKASEQDTRPAALASKGSARENVRKEAECRGTILAVLEIESKISAAPADR